LLFPAAALEDHFVEAGRYFTLVVEKGDPSAVGRNQYGQLGVRNFEDQDELTAVFIDSKVPPNDTVLAIDTGAFHTIFLLDNGEVFTTGRNNFGQLGIGTNINTATPTKVPLEGVKKVAAGYAHSLFLMDDGSVMACGLNQHGQLGIGKNGIEGNRYSSLQKVVPEFEGSESKVVDIVAGYDFSYFLVEELNSLNQTDRNLYATGQGLGGQLGFVASSPHHRKTVFTPRRSIDGVKLMAAGESHGLVLPSVGPMPIVMVTGANYAGQLGNGQMPPPAGNGQMPQAGWTLRMPPTPGIEGLRAGRESSCSSGAFGGQVLIDCWGNDNLGQIAVTGGSWDPSREAMQKTPKGVLYSSNYSKTIDVIDDISLGYDHGIFVNFDDVLVTGSNKYGQLGKASFGAGDTTLDFLVEFGNRGVRPTLAPTPATQPPTAAPSPGGTPAPSPGVTRDPNADDDAGGLPWEMLIFGAAAGLLVVLLFVGLGRVTDDEATTQAEAPSTELASQA